MLSDTPPQEIIILAGAAVAGYKAMFGFDKDDSYFKVNDLDICVAPAVHNQLAEKGWDKNTYRGVTTYRHEYRVNGLEFPVEIDAGMEANGWSYEEIRTHAVPYHRWRLMNPYMLEQWYLDMGRAKDQTKLDVIQNKILKVCNLPKPDFMARS